MNRRVLLASIALVLLADPCLRVGLTQDRPRAKVTVAQPIAWETAEFEYPCHFEPAERMSVPAPMAGTIARISVTPGDTVKTGAVLFEYAAEPMRTARDEAMAACKKLEARAADLARQLEDKPLQPFDRKRLEAQRGIAQVELQLARKQLASIEEELARSKVVAPMAGRVVEVAVKAGEAVVHGRALVTNLCTIVRTDRVRVEFSVSESSYLHYQAEVRAGRIKEVQPTDIKVGLALPGEQGFPHAGHLQSIDNRVDPRTHTLKFQAILDDPDGSLAAAAQKADAKKLTPRLRMKCGETRKVLLVPLAAVAVDREGEALVLVVNDKSAVETRAVKLGAQYDGRQVILEGLTGGDWVILTVDRGKRDTADPQLSPADFAANARQLGLAPGTIVDTVRTKLPSPK